MTAHDPAAAGLRARFRREEAALHAEGYLTLAEAMERLGVSRFTVNRMIGDGRTASCPWPKPRSWWVSRGKL